MQTSKQQHIPVKRGSVYTIDIAGLGHSGEGVGRYEDFTVFVPGALPGEQVSVRIDEVKKNYAKGRPVRIVRQSPERVQPPCPIYQACGGCQLQHLSYEEQLKVKQQQVIDAVGRIGKLDNVEIKALLAADTPWYYRNKMQFPVGKVHGKLAIGCYARGTHAIVNADNCMIQHEANNQIVDSVRKILTELGIEAYDEATDKGIVRHVLGRVGVATGEVMVVLVTAVQQLPRQPEIVARLQRSIRGLVSIVQNVNKRRSNVVLGNQTRTLWGQDSITDRLGKFAFHISAQSFFQVNTRQAEVLYQQALAYAGLTGREVVIDAYCGTGTISLFLAQQAKRVIGIEVVQPAIDNANANARLNGVENVEFIAGDAVDILPQLFEQGICPDVIVVDPPRAGCDNKVLEAFAGMQPRRIVYVSCNPASLARDLALLAGHGYRTRAIQPVDMFPMTSSVECVALIERE